MPRLQEEVEQVIYAVEECLNGSESSFFFFDESKVDPDKPFEVAYLDLLKKAATAPRKNITTELPGALSERCGDYQSSRPCWKRLLAKPPCQVDEAVTVWVF